MNFCILDNKEVTMRLCMLLSSSFCTLIMVIIDLLSQAVSKCMLDYSSLTLIGVPFYAAE